jgi:hypothetical protein
VPEDASVKSELVIELQLGDVVHLELLFPLIANARVSIND